MSEEKKVETGGPNRINRLLAEEVKSKFGGLTNLVMIRNNGLNSEETAETRAELRGKGASMRVVRNRVSIKAFRDMGVEDAEKLFDGPTAIIEAEDPVMAAKIAAELVKKFKDKLVIVGAVVEGKALDKKEANALAKSKSKPELLAQISGQIIGPAGQLAAALNGPAGMIASQIKSRVEELEKGEDGEEKAA